MNLKKLIEQWIGEEKKLAELFHDTYETLAPAHGYETREETKVFDPESKNGKLMIATCNFILQDLKSKIPDLIEQIEECRPEYRKDNNKVIFDNK